LNLAPARTGATKEGSQAVGVKRQYSGTAGDVGEQRELRAGRDAPGLWLG